jgi:hypothetical protein
MICIVKVNWDPEAHVYVATSDDVPGLATEHENADALMRKVMELAPELLLLNRRPHATKVRFELKRDEALPLASAA